MKLKTGTVLRIAALIVALLNQILAIFGKDLPFTENFFYQLISVLGTIVAAVIAAWKNNDVTHLARLTGAIFAALKEGSLLEEDLTQTLQAAQTPQAAGTTEQEADQSNTGEGTDEAARAEKSAVSAAEQREDAADRTGAEQSED